MDTNKIRGAQALIDEARHRGHNIPQLVEAARLLQAELDKAPKVLTDEQAHYLFMGWLHANHADINDSADMSDLCRRAFLDALRYARDNHSAAGLTVEEAEDCLVEHLAQYGPDWSALARSRLRARLIAAIQAKQ